jgi:glyoxylase-like metal-dependent hydrolase (beta-lactamase superfamily II)
VTTALAALGLLLALAAGAAPAASPPPASASPSATAEGAPLQASLVRTGLYMVSGGGGNALLRNTPLGTLLIGAKQPGQYAALMKQVRWISRLSDLPVRALLLTDTHPDTAGNAPEFMARGIPVVLASDAVRAWSDSGVAATLPGKAMLVPFEHDYAVNIAGVPVQAWHFGAARSRTSAVVYLPDMKVVAVGRLYDERGTPVPDDDGGSLAGWSRALGEVLAWDFDIVVPAEGPLRKRADLEAMKARVDAALAKL